MISYENLVKHITSSGLPFRVDVNDKEKPFVAFMPLENDVAVIIIKDDKEKLGFGINYVWGGLDGLNEAGEYKNKIDESLTNQVDWSLDIKNVINNIKNIIDMDIDLKHKNDDYFTEPELDDLITFLNDFINRWNDLDDIVNEKERSSKRFELEAEYSKFLEDNKLEEKSADELLIDLKNQILEIERKRNEEYENEKTAFNNSELFVKEYNDYLVGKKIGYNNGESEAEITEVMISDLDSSKVLLITKNGGFLVNESELQEFIDGEIIDNSDNAIVLILQEKEIEQPIIEEEKYNKPEYKYYVLNNSNNKIQSGFEYKEDADAELDLRTSSGDKNLVVKSKRSLIDSLIDPYDNDNWVTKKINYSIIEEAVGFGVMKDDYTQEQADRFISGYRENGKYKPVITARLIMYSNEVNRMFTNACMNYDYQAAEMSLETQRKINEQLLKLVKEDA